MKLFSEFDGISTEQWEKKILEDLKGADYNKKLIWKTIEGINVKPYYRAEDTKSIRNYELGINTNKKNNNDWEIRQDIEEEDVEEANKLALEAIKGGADAIGFRAVKVSTQKHISLLLKDIDFTKTAIHFISNKSYPVLFDLIEAEAKIRKIDISSARLSFNFDPLSYLLLHGNFYSDEKNNFYETAFLFSKIKGLKSGSQLKLITVNGHYFHNAGASAVQELAFSLSSANEYFAQLIEQGFKIDDIANRIMFSFAIGSGYFMEIAKLRAARILWTKILEVYSPQSTVHGIPYSSPPAMSIHCYTSSFNKSIYDPNNNMLRSTTEAMSAAIGGADSITVLPFDNVYRKPNEFSYRIARNTQIILKAESYLDKVIDPSAGSYYIENLTDSIAEAAWNLFKEVETKGGCLEAIKQNFIQNKIEETSGKRSELIADRKQTILGINMYPNSNESVSETIDKNFLEKNFSEEKSKIIRTLNIHRASKAFEQIRLETEKYVLKGHDRPKVFLLTIGNLTMRRARASFSTNFFGCSGYEIIDNNGFCSVDEGVEAAMKAEPQIVVICSSDEDYATVASETAVKIKAANPKIVLVVAGNPKNIVLKDSDKSLQEYGVDDFINLSTNLQVSLMNYQYKLGVI